MTRTLGPVGAEVIKFDGTKEKIHLVDGNGCEPGSNPGAEINHVKIYYADNIKSIKILPGAVHVSLSGNYTPEDCKTSTQIRKRSDKVNYEDEIEIQLSNTVENFKIWGIGNINELKIPKNVKKVNINYSDINILVFDKNCQLKELILNSVLLNMNITNKIVGKWPVMDKFSSYNTKFYHEVEIPDAPATIYGNFFIIREMKKTHDDIYEGKSIGGLKGKFNIAKVGDYYCGFGHKFSEKQLISFCSEIGLIDILSHFNLKPIYPIKKHKYAKLDKYDENYFSDISIYDEDLEEWVDTSRKSLKCYKGTPIIIANAWLETRNSMTIEGASLYPYLDADTNTFKYAAYGEISDEALTRERYDYLLKSLEMYYGKDWQKFTEPGDIISNNGLFSGQLLGDTEYQFHEVKKTKIKDLDWSVIPARCTVLTMNENGEWWGNENQYGLSPEHGSWKTYGGTGERWVNICKDIGVEIEPVKDWTKAYVRPAKYKVTPKPRKKDFGLCPFSGSAVRNFHGELVGDPEKPTRICSRTEDGSIGDCSTCRVAAEWEEAYG